MGELLTDADVIICTPFYNVQAFSPYVGSLAASLRLCWEAGMKTDYWQISGDSYVWRVRNTFAHKFLHQSKAKYLIFIDSDHAWDIMGFSNLIKAPVDVVGAAYPCKTHWDFWSVFHKIVEDGSERPMVDPATGLIEAVGVPTGMMKISRKAFETIEAYEPDNFYIDDKGTKFHGFFNHLIENGRALGEDISFCMRCARAGVSVWIEPNITIEHYGVESHRGNYAEFLMRQPGGSKEGQPYED